MSASTRSRSPRSVASRVIRDLRGIPRNSPGGAGFPPAVIARLAIAISVALVAATPAQAAAPKLVARGTPIGNPALAGKSVYFAQQGAARQIVVERVSGGHTRIVGRLGKGTIPVRVDASAAGY